MKKSLLVLGYPISLNNHCLARTMQVLAEAGNYAQELMYLEKLLPPAATFIVVYTSYLIVHTSLCSIYLHTMSRYGTHISVEDQYLLKMHCLITCDLTMR